MCIFSPNVDAVGRTRIFASSSAHSDRQYLVYSMAFASASDVAMILPLPVPPASREDAVRFIDLTGYPDFFDDLDWGFQRPPSEFLGIEEPSLKVHDVGSFEASYVPGIADFDRLDPRFRLTGDVWVRLPEYSDYGFAVFKLKPGAQLVHPMAFEFRTRSPKDLYFPTVHVHDGEVHAEARFDHSLYCQSAGPFMELDLSLWKHPGTLVGHFARICATNWDQSNFYMAHAESTPLVEWEVAWKQPGSLARFDLDRASPEEMLRDRLAKRSRADDAAHKAERRDPANHILAREFVSVERALGIVHPDLHVLRKHMVGKFRNQDVVLRG